MTTTAARIKALLEKYVAWAVEEMGPDREPRRIIPVAPGVAPAWDDPCGGQIYGRLAQISPGAEKVPGAAGSIPCRVPFLVLTLAIGVVRCAHTLDDRGRAPKVELVFEDGMEMIDDMVAVQAALLHPDAPTRSLVGWNPLEEEGGAHGGEWLFTVRLDLELPSAATSPGPAGLGG